jgi:hypothetical protein
MGGNADVSLAGKWTYRSYRNDPSLVGDDANKALGLIFAEAVFTLDISDAALKGTIDWTGGGLDLEGDRSNDGVRRLARRRDRRNGAAGTSTAGWEYDYRAQLER